MRIETGSLGLLVDEVSSEEESERRSIHFNVPQTAVVLPASSFVVGSKMGLQWHQYCVLCVSLSRWTRLAESAAGAGRT
jgi:hypothetical protein